MNLRQTDRGFDRYEFEDANGETCSLQKSSSAEEPKIWLGINDANPQIMASKVMENGVGWVKYPIPEDVLLSTRMHLTQHDAADLILILEQFIDTGEIT